MAELPILTEATFERLLNRGHYGIIGNQLLFFSHELGKYVLTQISDKGAGIKYIDGLLFLFQFIGILCFIFF